MPSLLCTCALVLQHCHGTSMLLFSAKTVQPHAILLQCPAFWPASSLTPCYNYYNKELPKELQNSYSALKCSADGNYLYRYDTTLV